MNTREHWFPGRLTAMPDRECRDLVGSTSVGRVAFVDEEGPVVLPINYTLDGDQVLFRTAADNTLARHLDGSAVAFEVDEFDDFTQSGWSVLVRGVARFVPPDEVSSDEARRPFAWAGGRRDQFIRVTPTSVTGRRLLPA